MADDTVALQQALSSAIPVVRIPPGDYRVTATLRVPSRKTIEASGCARIFSDGDTPKRRGDFLLTNADPASGNEGITLRGGIWDGNNAGPCNRKSSDLFLPDGWSGTALNFQRVRGLRLENITVANSAAYNIRLGHIDGFDFRHIRFHGDRPVPNQDGLHFGGCCRNGRVHDVRAISKGQTNDDLVALNADDSLERVENRDLSCGPIENIVFSDLYAEDCHTGIRLLSVRSTIRNIRFRNVNVGVRCFAVNADAARYCRTPLFQDADFPHGVGRLDRIEFDGIRVHATFPHVTALFLFESNMAGVRMRDIVRDTAKDAAPSAPILLARHVSHASFAWRIASERRKRRAALGADGAASGELAIPGAIAELSVSSTAPVRDGERFRSHLFLEKGDFLVTSPFGCRTHPVTGEEGSFHRGVDAALWDGRMLVETGICAFRSGVVAFAGSDPARGAHVVVDHGDGLVTRYCHLEEGSLRVKTGESVRRGQLLGWMGRTGCATGEHLHFEMERDGVPIDPLPFLRAGSAGTTAK
jgi:murein DD-endopeptidase MepM/ murein hydrolase activator NlpD